MRALASLAPLLVGVGLLAAPAAASAAPRPKVVDVEICYLGSCNDVVFRASTVETAPFLYPNTGALYNSGGFVGEYFFDPYSGMLQFGTIFAPGSVFIGTVDANACIEGAVYSVGTYSFLGDFYSIGECQ